MTTETTWIPRTMASDTVHVFIVVSAIAFLRNSTPTHRSGLIHMHRLGHVTPRIIRLTLRIDGLGGLRYNPL